MNILSISLLRVYVYFMWNVQQIIDYIRGKRSVYIPITDLRIIYQNEGLLVLDKSHELLINSRRPWGNCVTLQMQHMFRFVNRLDAPTSGLICIAYTPKAAGMASKAFQNRATKKLYLAVVWGHVQDSSSLDPTSLPTSKYLPELNVNPSLCTEMCKKTGDMEYTVDIAIGDYQITWPSGCIQKIMVPYFVTDCWRPRPAQTKITVLKHGFLEGAPASLLLLEPHSGRRHQLRLHCALGLRGHPIAGDLIYGRLFAGEKGRQERDYRMPRLMLHAYSLHLQLVPKPPFVKGEKKQARVARSHPQPVELHFESTRDLFRYCNWIDTAVFHAI